ncbi:hypothetical protein I79_004449 [Cricetulus griseus]|uniref:Uncharacterized protein n=1 Tax=Cricetulus griseus TaxID=10029 RepID=G3H2N2_CRIGR|nr:hypothetical protein I79_004449 [Cricetulus griseus]
MNTTPQSSPRTFRRQGSGGPDHLLPGLLLGHHKTFPMSWVPEATLHFFTLIARCVAILPCLCPDCRTLSQDTMWLEPFLE